jgi:hypothetical protein
MATTTTEPAAACPPVPGGPQAQAEVARLREAAAVYPWKPRSGTTDRLILEAHLDIAARTGRIEHDASVRDLASGSSGLRGAERSTASPGAEEAVRLQLAAGGLTFEVGVV